MHDNQASWRPVNHAWVNCWMIDYCYIQCSGCQLDWLKPGSKYWGNWNCYYRWNKNLCFCSAFLVFFRAPLGDLVQWQYMFRVVDRIKIYCTRLVYSSLAKSNYDRITLYVKEWYLLASESQLQSEATTVIVQAVQLIYSTHWGPITIMHNVYCSW